MSEQVITCPRCGCEIPLTEAISSRLREQISREMEAAMAEREAALRQRLRDAEERERELEERRRGMDEELGRRLEEARAELEKQAAEKAREAQLQEMQDLRNCLEDQERKLEEMRKQELDLRRRQRELEQARQEQELEMERRLDRERKKLDEEIGGRLRQEYELKEKEYQTRLEALTKQLEDAKRSAEGGSGRDMGEAWEEVLEVALRRLCPADSITPVKTGSRGADLLQAVRDDFGNECGTIIWEAKNTRNWSDDWIDKLRSDQQAEGADLAVIVSRVLPRAVKGLGNLRGVWVCDRASMEGLVFALRLQLQEVARARAASQGKGEKMEMLYEYLSGQAFRQKVENIVEAFITMQKDLQSERRSMEKIWKKREKQIERVIASTTGMYGELQGIIGASMPEIGSLELKAIAGGSEEGEELREDI